MAGYALPEHKTFEKAINVKPGCEDRMPIKEKQWDL